MTAAFAELGGRRILALLAVYLIWGSTYLGIRVMVETMPPFLSGSARFLFSGCLFYLWARLRGSGRPTLGQWRTAAIVGALLFLGGTGIVAWSEQWLASGMVAMLISTEPLVIALLLGFWPGETDRPRRGTYAALIVGLAGAVLLAGSGRVVSDEPAPWFAPGLVILATLSWAVGSLYGRDAPAPENPFLRTGMQMFAGGALLGMMGLARGEMSGLDPGTFSTASIVAFLYLTFFGSMIGFGAYSWLLRTTHAMVVSTYAYVNPVIAVFLGWLLVDEPVDGRTLLSSALILGAVFAVLHRRPSQTNDPPVSAAGCGTCGTYE